MLINTVLILLREGLPIVFVFAFFLLLNTSHQSFKQLLVAIFVGGIITLLQLFWFNELSNTIDLLQLEQLHSAMLLVIYICIAGIFINQSRSITTLTQWLWQLLVIFILMLYFSNFIIYIAAMITETAPNKTLWLGTLLGLGICVSVGVLFYFTLLHILKNNHKCLVAFIFLLYGCGQLMSAIKLLIQLDYLPSLASIWDSSALLKENSELGYFFMALLGYEATPNLLHIVSYIFALFIPLLSYYFITRHLLKVTELVGVKQ